MRRDTLSADDAAAAPRLSQRRRPGRSLLYSLLGHALVAVVWVRASSRAWPESPADATANRIEIDFERAASQHASAPTIDRTRSVPPSPPLARRPAERSARVRPPARVAAPREIDVAAVRPAVSDPNAVSTLGPRLRARLSAAELLTPGVGATIALGDAPGRASDVGRSLFGGATHDVAAIAGEPTRRGLAESANRQAAGTMDHDRTTSRRVAEQLVRVNLVPGLAEQLMRAPLQVLPPVEHTPTAGELAISDSGEFGHGDHGLLPLLPGGASACPPPHVIRIRFDVNQDADETIASIRIAHSSGIAVVDATAREALESTLRSVPRIGAHQLRSSVWTVEIANRPRRSDQLCTEGWMVFPRDPAGGVYLMIRVARTRL